MRKQSKLYIAVASLVIASAVFAAVFINKKPDISDKNAQQSIQTENKESFDLSPITASDVDPKELEQYYRVYENPYVLYLRQALNAYLANDSSQTCIFQGAVTEFRREGIITGLTAFNKDYYKSKFIVVTISDNTEDGKDIQIIFQDKPDRIFYAWVGKNPYGQDCLLAFNSKEDFDNPDTKEKMKMLLEPYRDFIADKEHSL